MAILSITALKAQVDSTIATNGVKAITGAILNTQLNDIIDSVNKLSNRCYVQPTTPAFSDMLSGDIWIKTDTDELYTYDGATFNLQDLSGSIASLSNYILLTEKGAVNGVATLDGGGKVPSSQLPSTVMDYKGNWNATTNTPTLIDGTGDAGDVYRVSVGGTIDLGSGSNTYSVGDWVIYSGTIWEQSDNSDAVVSVNGLTGIVTTPLSDVLVAGSTSSGNDLTITDLDYLNVGAASIQYNSGIGYLEFNNGDIGFLFNSGGESLRIAGDGYIEIDRGLYRVSLVPSVLTANRTINVPDNAGTIALTTDIPTISLANVLSTGNTSSGTDVIISTGDKLGIGVATPLVPLDVKANGDGVGTGITLRDDSSTSAVVDIHQDTNAGKINLLSALAIKTHLDANGNSYFNGGNVGIGTDTPTELLHLEKVTGTATLDPLRIKLNSTGNASDWTTYSDILSLDFATNDASGVGVGTKARISMQTTNAVMGAVNMVFSTSQSTLDEQVVIDFAGKVGIGDMTPTEKLDVAGNIKVSGDMLKMTGITTTARNLLTAVAGDIIYNTTDNKHQGYDGSTWSNLY